MPSRTRFWNVVLVLLSAANVVAGWFAARSGEPLHATIHAALALSFGLWAQRRLLREAARWRAGALEPGDESEVAALRDEVGQVQREVAELEERLDFVERLLSQTREGERLPGRRET